MNRVNPQPAASVPPADAFPPLESFSPEEGASANASEVDDLPF